MSADGLYVAWTGTATNVVNGQVDTKTDLDAFLYDRMTGTNVLLPHSHTSPVQLSDGFLHLGPELSPAIVGGAQEGQQRDLVRCHCETS